MHALDVVSTAHAHQQDKRTHSTRGVIFIQIIPAAELFAIVLSNFTSLSRTSA